MLRVLQQINANATDWKVDTALSKKLSWWSWLKLFAAATDDDDDGDDE